MKNAAGTSGLGLRYCGMRLGMLGGCNWACCGNVLGLHCWQDWRGLE